MAKPEQQNLFDADQLPLRPEAWERAAGEDRLAAQVVFNRPLETVFHYLVPDELREIVTPGQRLRAPFGRGDRSTVGFCVGVGLPPETGRRLKSIQEVIDREPLLSPQMLELTRWIAEYYLCPWGQVLDSVVPAGVKRQAGTRIINFFQPAPGVASQIESLKLPPKQRAVLEALCRNGGPMRAEELTEAADCGTSPINGLRQKGLICAVRGRSEVFKAEVGPVPREDDLILNADQQRALRTILGSLRSRRHRSILLHGVTGSGKTEVYIQAVREVVGYGRQAIVLVPEISLTPQTIRRFRRRFNSVAVLHSHLSDAERHWHWQQIARGAVQVVVGARSAIFAPTPHLGLIVIDEEHETTFKQETAPRYHAREVGRRRAELEQIPLVLGTATPTLESWHRVRGRKDTLIRLPRRVEQLPLPPVVVVDVRNDPHISRGAAVGRALATAMQRALKDGGQVILFLNVRGYSPVLWCRACGQSVKCPHCDVTLTWHKHRKKAVCHSCQYETTPPACCPVCNHAGIRNLGVGTQRLEQEVRARFADYKALRMDSDAMQRPGSHDDALEQFRRGDVQILLGTQMIAKGLDFPNVTLVGVVDADTILHQPDLRAAERTFQLIAQVAGRTGRSLRGGRVLVQTTCPAEPAIVLASKHDYERFAEQELGHRRARKAPPFQHVARVILRGPVEESVRESAKRMASAVRETADRLKSDVRLLGPAPAPVTRLKDNYRYHLMLAHDDVAAVRQLWRTAAEKFEHDGDVQHVVDVDPLNLR